MIEERLFAFKSQENHEDKSVSDLANKNSSFIKAVLENIG